MTTTQEITLNVAGARVTLPAATLTDLWLDKLRAETAQFAPRIGSYLPPSIGQAWPAEGGVYAGVARGQDGEPDHHLIVHADARESITWKSAMEWAESLQAGPSDLLIRHSDYTLPMRHEQALLFANVPELFAKEWYWSSVEYAGNTKSAWIQHFDTGYQDYYRKDNKLRARSVRRVPIQ